MSEASIQDAVAAELAKIKGLPPPKPKAVVRPSSSSSSSDNKGNKATKLLSQKRSRVGEFSSGSGGGRGSQKKPMKKNKKSKTLQGEAGGQLERRSADKDDEEAKRLAGLHATLDEEDDEEEEEEEEDDDEEADTLALQPAQVKFRDIKVGLGVDAARRGGRVEVHYVGRLAGTGKTFDSNEGKEPLRFRIGDEDVVEGFEDGVVGMRVGGEREFIVPPELGYGGERHGKIPPHSTLRFTVELLNVQPF